MAFIRRFEDDYRARTDYLTDNYRSTYHIIAAANALIEQAAERMKVEHPIQVDLGFAGRRGPGHPVHAAIAELRPGSSLELRKGGSGRWELLNAAGTVVGRLARRWETPAGMRCISAAVYAVVTRSRTMSDPQYLDRLKCETWEVVVPETGT